MFQIYKNKVQLNNYPLLPWWSFCNTMFLNKKEKKSRTSTRQQKPYFQHHRQTFLALTTTWKGLLRGVNFSFDSKNFHHRKKKPVNWKMQQKRKGLRSGRLQGLLKALVHPERTNKALLSSLNLNGLFKRSYKVFQVKN